MKPLFQDRRDAGRVLASKLLSETTVSENAIVLALPRGGVPVAYEVASGLRAQLDICVVRRLEVPGQNGVVMGALASDRVLVILQPVIDEFSVSEQELTQVVRKQARELVRREKAYRGESEGLSLRGRTVILVDDGLAACGRLTTAIAAIRVRMPQRLIVALPVATAQSYAELLRMADEVVCLELPQPFHTVGTWYADFSEVSDLDVRRLHAAAVSCAPRRPTLN